jgi:ribosome biogenesis protein Nip4
MELRGSVWYPRTNSSHRSDVSRLLPQETKQVFEKLHTYIGKNIKNLVERPDEDHVLRLHKNRVYYVRESLMRKATNVRNDSRY